MRHSIFALLLAVLSWPVAGQPVLNIYNWADYIDPGVVERFQRETGIRVRYETVRVHLKAAGIVLSRPQHTITSPDPEYAFKKRRSKRPATALSNRETTSTTRMSST